MAAQYLYLTTTGRMTGSPRRIEIWFVEGGGRYYVLSYLGDQAQWVKNILRNPRVRVQVDDREFEAAAHVLDEQRDAGAWRLARRLFEEKYGWGDGLPVELTPV